MTADRRRKRHKQPGPCPGCPGGGFPRPADSAPGQQPSDNDVTEQGMASDAKCSRLRRIKRGETDDLIRRRRAHIDDLIRVFRNLAVLASFSVATLGLVAFAGFRMGIPPVACIAGGVSGATLLVRVFTKAFEAVRPSLPNAPEDPPSSGGR